MLLHRNILKQAIFKRNILIITFVTIFGFTGLWLLIGSKAATGDNTLEPENGTVSAPATTVTDANASGGKYVLFKSASQGSCAVSTPNVPDGPDPWGGCWPGPATTGYPHGLPGDTRAPVNLTSDTNCVITTDNITLNSRKYDCDVVIQAKNVTIKNSLINGQLYLDSDFSAANNKNWSFALIDSEVNAPMLELPAVYEGTMTLLRANIHGGITSVQCEDKALKCDFQESYLHGQLIQQRSLWHLGAFHSIGGSNYTITHNSVFCDQTYTYEANNDSGGCSGDIVFIPYDVNISHAIVNKNLLGANQSIAYCLYGGDKGSFAATYMSFTDNVFQRTTTNINGQPDCGDYGAVDGFGLNNTGNVWLRNVWATGGNVDP